MVRFCQNLETADRSRKDYTFLGQHLTSMLHFFMLQRNSNFIEINGLQNSYDWSYKLIVKARNHYLVVEIVAHREAEGSLSCT